MRGVFRAALVSLALAGSALAQELEPRHELGQRLVRMERAYAQAELGARSAALPALDTAVQAFFRNSPAEAAAALDGARRALLPAHASASIPAWLDGLALLPETRVVDVPGTLLVRIERFYGPALPATAACRLRLGSGPVLSEPFLLEARAKELSLTLPASLGEAGDDRLVLAVLAADGSECASIDVGLSLVSGLERRLDQLAPALEILAASVDSRIDLRIDSAVANLALLEELYAGTVFEADLPAAALLMDVEAMAAPLLARTGRRGAEGSSDAVAARETVERWVAVRVPTGALIPCRFLDASGVQPSRPPALVVALHGAGASEHMVFDGFGAGAFVEEAARRGWSVLAPRVELAEAWDVADLVDAVAAAYPVDLERVALVGHSLGAGLAIASVERTPGRWRALAALGGGRPPVDAGAFDGVHVLAGGGRADFGLPGARALYSALTAREERREPTLTRFYVAEGAEHLTAVQASLSAVFALLDVALRSN